MSVPTKDSTFNAATLCRMNGWEAGTLLRGTETGPGWSSTTTILITAIGETTILAREAKGGFESCWTLECRNWEKIGTAPLQFVSTEER